jgi:hypothetical protein
MTTDKSKWYCKNCASEHITTREGILQCDDCGFPTGMADTEKGKGAEKSLEERVEDMLMAQGSFDCVAKEIIALVRTEARKELGRELLRVLVCREPWSDGFVHVERVKHICGLEEGK